MIECVCFKWGTQYSAEHVNRLAAMLARNLSVKHRLTCFTDDPSGVRCRTLAIPDTVKGAELTGRKRRYVKLWAYSEEIGEQLKGRRLLLLDLDLVIVDEIDALVKRSEPIVFWSDPHQKTPYNSSLVLMDVGARKQVWDQFDPQTSPGQCDTAQVIGHDQCWAGLVLGDGEATWTKADGVLSMTNDVMRRGLPDNARVVVFHGPRDPSHEKVRRQHPWIAKHWRLSRALVIGSGDRVRRELARVDRADYDVVIGINAAAAEFSPVDYLVTLHPEHHSAVNGEWVVANRKESRQAHVDIITPFQFYRGNHSGSSGLFAVKFALNDLGMDEVTLAGVGMDYAPHFDDDQIWNPGGYRRGWMEALPYIQGRVNSLGGWTAELLNGRGSPEVCNP